MKQLAAFVEGYTEAIFVEKLIEEIAGKNKVQIERIIIRGGSTVPRTMRVINATGLTGLKFQVLIFDCGSDDQVKTRILEEHENLTKKGYISIIGVRDVRPTFSYAEIPKLELNLPKYIKTSLAPVTFILSIMEIEAWFLSDYTHFKRIDPSITNQRIIDNLGFDPENDNLELRSNPTEDINNCYALGGKLYKKNQTQKTIDALDYELVYIELRKKNRYLDKLILSLENFLT